ncbi:PilN domain-containing protein [Gilvimarinus polysaccharolyticus]|uniref:PilN domain-containing protein n=1 Tax=Gilvimarinus polysaccharolyticus TaxID=863921 RepID=UPI000673555E|nr:PilN domain-containing protein [Gilvimarinus polysaccharolyticus]
MAHINLLPWRVKDREKKKKDFITIMVGVAIVTAVVAYLWISHAQGKVDHQTQRNQILKTEIASLESKVSELNDLQQRRDDLLALMKLIRDLEGTRSVIVHHFDELVRALPDGVYLVSVKREGAVMSIEGFAESNNRVSSFMRNLDASEWYAEPNLASVDAAPSQGGQANAFSMTVKTVVSKAQQALQDQEEQ